MVVWTGGIVGGTGTPSLVSMQGGIKGGGSFIELP